MPSNNNRDWLNNFIEKNALAIVAFFIGLATAWGSFNIRVKALEKKVDRYSDLVERVIILEEREKQLEEDVTEIKQNVREIKKKVNTLD